MPFPEQKKIIKKLVEPLILSNNYRWHGNSSNSFVKQEKGGEEWHSYCGRPASNNKKEELKRTFVAMSCVEQRTITRAKWRRLKWWSNLKRRRKEILFYEYEMADWASSFHSDVMVEQRGLSEFRVEGVSTTALAVVLLLTGERGALVRPLFLLCGGVSIPRGPSAGLGGDAADSVNRLWAASLRCKQLINSEP